MTNPRNRHRIVVQLINNDNDEDYEEIPVLLRSAARAGLTSTVPNPPAIPHIRAHGYPDVEAIDQNTLKLTVDPMHPLQMQFDCVGSASEAHVQSEMSALMVKLIANHCDCCMVRFSVMRECQAQFICQRLLREMETQLINTRTKMNMIHMEYFDVRKYEVVKMLTRRYQFQPPPKDTGLPSRLTFNTVMDLMRWFHNKYHPLWNGGIAHEFFEFSLTLTDSSRRSCQVKLALMLNYLNKLDFDTKYTLIQFWENLANGKRMKHSMLTDYIKEYYLADGKWVTWTFFNIPIIYGGGMLIEDMLMLANAANAGLRKMYAKTGAVQRLSRLGEEANVLSAFGSNNSMVTLSSFRRIAAGGDKAVVSKNHHNLSYWYNKVDELFNMAILYMEEYYYHLSETKITQMCTDIKLMLRAVDKLQNTSENFIPNVSSADGENYAEYKNAMEDFKRLANEIAKTSFEPLLRVHLKTKTFDLQQRVIRFKVRLLQKCQSCLSIAIKKEMSELNDMKISPMKMMNGIAV